MRFILLICVAVLFCNICLAIESESGCSVPECINNGNSDQSTVIICNACVARGLWSSDGSFNKFRQKLRSIGATNSNEKTLGGLNVDVLVVIFEHLEMNDILNLARAEFTPTISAAVKHVYSKNFKNYLVRMGYWSGVEDIMFFTEDNKRVAFNARKAPKLLRIIGSEIRNLFISDLQANVTQYVNQFARNSLVRLELNVIHEDTFVSCKHPFTSLQELIFDYSQYDESRTDQLPLNQIFPNIRNLTLNIGNRIDYNFNFTTFENLEILKLNEVNEYLTENQTEAILSKNPQIRNFEFERLSQKMANIISRHLVNLENITVSKFDIQEKTRFENVKNLVIKSKAETINKLSCPQIIGCEIQYVNTFELFKPLSGFLAKHQTLTHLKIQECYGDSIHSVLVMLTSINKALSEITIGTSNKYIQAETVIEIIENNENLKRLHVLDNNLKTESLNTLQETLGNDWNIISNQRNTTLEKKN